MKTTGETRAAVESVSRWFQHRGLTPPLIGIILGSGLGAAGQRLLSLDGFELPYEAIPNMPAPRVAGHAGRLVAATIGDTTVVTLSGRVHAYEGHAFDSITFATRMLAAIGVQTLVITNAAGGIRAGFQPGDLMLIRDHLRRPGMICGDVDSLCADHFDSPFRRRNRPWSDHLIQTASAIPTSLTIHQGVYAMMPGPNYETPAEIRMLRALGADAVGMSTVPEAVVAATLGVSILGVSCITNIAAGLSEQTLSHHDVTATASAVEQRFVDWMFEVMAALQGIEHRGNSEAE